VVEVLQQAELVDLPQIGISQLMAFCVSGAKLRARSVADTGERASA
jgi:hypothetical protein